MSGRKKEEGRRKKEEGRRKKEEGRRKKEEGKSFRERHDTGPSPRPPESGAFSMQHDCDMLHNT